MKQLFLTEEKSGRTLIQFSLPRQKNGKREGKDMDSLIYSLTATVPVFLVIVLGHVLRRIGLLDGGFVTVSNAFNFRVTLPVLLFCDMAGSHLREEFDVRLVLFCATVTTVMFFAIWFLARLLLRDKSLVGAFVQACCRSSVAVLGVAFITNIYGNAGMAPQMILGSVPLFNIYAVVVLAFEGEHTGSTGDNLIRAARGAVTNPIIIGLALGMLASLLDLSFPPMVNKTLGMVGGMATPQALICIGAGFEGRKAVARLKPTLAAAAVKLMALPAVFLPLAVLLGFREQALLAIVIMLGSPVTPSSYVMAKTMGGDDALTSSAIVATTLLSAFTLTFWIFLFRQLAIWDSKNEKVYFA